MILCDLCGQARECLQKEIDGKEFDICGDCWRPLEEKLKGKGRVKRKNARRFCCRHLAHPNRRSQRHRRGCRQRSLVRPCGRIRTRTVTSSAPPSGKAWVRPSM